MKITYKRLGKRTLATFGGLIGLARVSRGDKFDPLVGIAVAAIKARDKNRMDGQERDIVDALPWSERIDHELVLTDKQAATLMLHAVGYQKAVTTNVHKPVRRDWVGSQIRETRPPPVGVLAENVGRQLAVQWRDQGVEIDG